ncbi:hypothetical protein HYFRA_00013889 [Hymenoscyphus fraxineus]|uniref:TeaA receptor TeaR n=1 Tax=Hymenoscyphus fraxineus TaxID=746836 RepID=A0A9N9L8J0_9HELO|nr:hypothetical protein HYFRA_00013889 [Hymenoscyphus fraxineus]
MAAVSAPQAPSSLTSPTSSHEGTSSWNYSVPSQSENRPPSKMSERANPPSSHMNGHVLGHKSSRSDLSQRRGDYANNSQGHLIPSRVNELSRKNSSISDGSAPDSLLDLYGTNKNGMANSDLASGKFGSKESYDESDPEHSRWIHRDKLARIESQELQAAGIILPRARRGSSKSRTREHSRDQSNGPRQRRRIEEEPFPTQEPEEPESWDLRLPGEAEEDPRYMDGSGGVKGVSRIPVLKDSPLPIPIEHLERDTILPRRQGGSVTPEEDQISLPKSRGRSQSIKMLEDTSATPTPPPPTKPKSGGSPTKKTPASKSNTRVASAPQKNKPKPTRTRDTNSGGRPNTRSNDLGQSNSLTKRPEGDPPWLATMYKPDPRLPPDQQLLPTVAKRLQQEQWEKEGKFGNAYDTQFRPLNDNEIIMPNSPMSPNMPITPDTAELAPEPSHLTVEKPEERVSAEWPLKAPKSPALSIGRPGTATRVASFSTMPKVTETSQGVGPLPSPNPPIRMQLPPEDSKKNGLCGCCLVM